MCASELLDLSVQKEILRICNVKNKLLKLLGTFSACKTDSQAVVKNSEKGEETKVAEIHLKKK